MNATTAAPLPRRHFSLRRVLLCATPLLGLLLWIVALSGGDADANDQTGTTAMQQPDSGR